MLTVIAAIAILSARALSEGASPPLAVISPANGQLLNVSSTLVVGTTSPNATVNVSVDRSFGPRVWYETTADGMGRFELQVGLFEEGNAIGVTATDGTGGSSTVNLGVHVDTIPPRMRIVSPSTSPAHTRSPIYTIVVLVEDDTTGPCTMAIDIDLGEVTGVTSRAVNLAEGENVFNVIVRDRAGNAAKETVTIIADFTPPVLTVGEPPYRTVITNGTSLRLAGNVSGATRVVIERGGNETTNAIPAGGDWATVGAWEHDMDLGPGEGTFYVTVRALDAVGNEVQIDICVTVDRTPPGLDIWPDLPWRAKEKVLIILGTTETGMDTVTVNGIAFPAPGGRFCIAWDLAEGPNDMVIEARDAAGNVARHEGRVVYSDGPPGLRLHCPDRSDGPEVLVRGETDANVALAYVGGVPVAVTNGSFEATAHLKRGVNRITVQVRDPAGNTASKEVEVRYGPSTAEAMALVLVAVAIAGAVGLLLKRVRGRPSARSRAPETRG